MEKVKHNFGITEFHLVCTFFTFCLAFSLFGVCSNLILCLVSVLYPAVCSGVALEEEATLERRKWLKYWLILAGMFVLDN
jgi:hypothetical protein